MSVNSNTQRDSLSFDRLKTLLSHPPVVTGFFLPLSYSRLQNNKLTIDNNKVAPNTSGVRILLPDPTNRDLSLEKYVQGDLKGLVQSVIELRKAPELAGATLSEEIIVGKNPSGGYRAQFGITFPADGKFKSESQAAAECQRQILQAVKRAGYLPESTEDATDFASLDRWVSKLRLKNKPQLLSPKWLLGLLPLLLLLLLWFLWPKSLTFNPANQDVTTFVGIELQPQSFIILLDISGSMERTFPTVQKEATKAFQDLLKMQGRKTHVNLIVYNDQADTVLGGIKELTPSVMVKITDHIQKVKAGGGTELQKAMKLAGAEVIQHNQQTTIIVLTDGEDASIASMIANKDQLRSWFGNIPVTVHMTHPDLISVTNAVPKNDAERNMADFAKLFGGSFGPTPKTTTP
jgi:hypothetical protein